MSLEVRINATQKTFDKYNEKQFELGVNDCARMTAFHLKQLGHKFSLLKGGQYSTEVGARLALKRLGVDSLNDILDRHFPKLDAPAFANVGDVISTAGKGDMGDALGIVLHSNRVLMFLDGKCQEVIVTEYKDAWRVV